MSTTDTRAMRQEFVAYWRARYQYSPTHAFLDEFGNFCTPKDDPVHMGWEAWQAATEAAKPEKEEDSQIRWCADGQIFGRPTATDALEYAEQRLRDPEEMICCKSDMRLDAMPNIRDLLSVAKATGTAGEQVGAICHTGDVEAVAEAIFKVMKPSNMIDRDWKSGAILGFENSFRDQVKTAARAAIEAARQPAPVVVVKTWEDRANEDGAFPIFSGDQITPYMKAEIADLRASLAATNRSQP